ncbi:hypothetical protein G7047_19410 [Diaphorobacter sp. HDW4A]|uniref:hypothetical protein n=1 Tax=Diaphorobacter sp. HDW4A TaxID=2714924 RepID=UPI0014099497|nr:hypothetical protein [Diaphorobacter sp. HDW4A]QIL81844.1 hypothetical protein G7047_19410 [Diaphorobacter sp. HDW4A]
MARAPTKPVQMAYLTIGYSHFLMDASKAMKVAELMQHAVNVEWDYGERMNAETYTVGESVNVEFRLVHASKIRMPHGDTTPATPAQRRLLK